MRKCDTCERPDPPTTYCGTCVWWLCGDCYPKHVPHEQARKAHDYRATMSVDAGRAVQESS